MCACVKAGFFSRHKIDTCLVSKEGCLLNTNKLGISCAMIGIFGARKSIDRRLINTGKVGISGVIMGVLCML